jgi:hypothetical protein
MAGKSSTEIITDMEAAGQRQLVASQLLPTNTYGTDAEFEAVGFVFGDPLPDDPMFRPAALPQGWSKRGSDHDMWSYVVDEHGRDRVSVFYKAAFYDRSAHMSMDSLGSYISACRYHGRDIVADPTWATPAAISQAAAELADHAAKEVADWQRHLDMGSNPEMSRKYVEQYTAEREQYLAIAARFRGETAASNA